MDRGQLRATDGSRDRARRGFASKVGAAGNGARGLGLSLLVLAALALVPAAADAYVYWTNGLRAVKLHRARRPRRHRRPPTLHPCLHGWHLHARPRPRRRPPLLGGRVSRVSGGNPAVYQRRDRSRQRRRHRRRGELDRRHRPRRRRRRCRAHLLDVVRLRSGMGSQRPRVHHRRAAGNARRDRPRQSRRHGCRPGIHRRHRRWLRRCRRPVHLLDRDLLDGVCTGGSADPWVPAIGRANLDGTGVDRSFIVTGTNVTAISQSTPGTSTGRDRSPHRRAAEPRLAAPASTAPASTRCSSRARAA